MNLLLDARKKAQKSLHDQSKENLHPDQAIGFNETPNNSATANAQSAVENQARHAGKNLFNAKHVAVQFTPAMHTNRTIQVVAGITALLLATGIIYWWLNGTDSNTISTPNTSRLTQTTTERSINTPSPTLLDAPIALDSMPEDDHAHSLQAEAMDENKFPNQEPILFHKKTSLPASTPDEYSASPTQSEPRIKLLRSSEIEQSVPRIDPLLSTAYSAYQDGNLGKAQQLYLEIFKKHPRNIDALLGLAAIAQRNGDHQSSVQYYIRVLALDPRNAPANAGISALSKDVDNNEAHLKKLLAEQGSSAALHFALGNLYADQARWNEAQQAYFNAYTLDAENAKLIFNLAVSLDHLEQYKLAAQYYQRALQLDSSNSAGFDHKRISQRAQELTR